ncbi:hypothetical protein C8R46DRAFT_389052 [Mycena filopes]|nr:hypothetical protein C8R46DRAFT_389052 [Mycena filopes]
MRPSGRLACCARVCADSTGIAPKGPNQAQHVLGTSTRTIRTPSGAVLSVADRVRPPLFRVHTRISSIPRVDTSSGRNPPAIDTDRTPDTSASSPLSTRRPWCTRGRRFVACGGVDADVNGGGATDISTAVDDRIRSSSIVLAWPPMAKIPGRRRPAPLLDD